MKRKDCHAKRLSNYEEVLGQYVNLDGNCGDFDLKGRRKDLKC